jgi:hypothetical protein
MVGSSRIFNTPGVAPVLHLDMFKNGIPMHVTQVYVQSASKADPCSLPSIQISKAHDPSIQLCSTPADTIIDGRARSDTVKDAQILEVNAKRGKRRLVWPVNGQRRTVGP